MTQAKHVVVTRAASTDLKRNSDWSASHHSQEQADRWLSVVESQFGTLSGMLESHPLSMENDQFPFEIREKLVGLGQHRSYRAVFTVRQNLVVVLTVRRASQRSLKQTDIRFD